jgi:hypothetical protein
MSKLDEWIEVLKNPIAERLDMESVASRDHEGTTACAAGEWLVQKHGLRIKKTLNQLMTDFGHTDIYELIAEEFNITVGESLYICYSGSYLPCGAFTHEMIIEHIEQVKNNA